jgi:hypothetical protein
LIDLVSVGLLGFWKEGEKREERVREELVVFIDTVELFRDENQFLHR